MKKSTKTVLLIGTMGLAFASCQKDNLLIDRPVSSVIVSQNYSFSVNGEIFSSNEDWNILMGRLLALAREGYEVTVFNNNVASPLSCKETVTFTTSDPDEATVWSKHMYEEGYTVTISYDDKTGIYTCIAVK